MNGGTMRMMMAVAGCVLAAACAGGGPTDTTDPRNQQAAGGVRLETRALYPGRMHYSGIEERQRTALRRQRDWEAFWAESWRGTSPERPLPAVDFSREMVVVAAMGMRATGGYGITIDSVTATVGATHVFVTEISPGRGCGTTQALTHPVDAVAVPDNGSPVLFHEKATEWDCG